MRWSSKTDEPLLSRGRSTAVLAGLLALGTMSSSGAATETLAAKSSGGSVKVKGWATFSGATMAKAEDKKADGKPDAQTARTKGAEITEAAWIYRPELEDFFVRIELTGIPTVGGLAGKSIVGDPTTLYVVQFETKGINYQIRIQNNGGFGTETTPLDPAFGLFECDEVLCTEVAKLNGGYGTVGEKIVVALPWKTLAESGSKTKLQEGDTINDILVYTATGTYNGGNNATPPVFIDDIKLSKGKTTIPKKSVKVTVKNQTKKASLKDGYFEVDFPKGLFSRSGATPVKTRTCLGRKCATDTFKIKT